MEALALWVGVLAGGVFVVLELARGVRRLWRSVGFPSKRREGIAPGIRGAGWFSRVPLLDKSIPGSGLHGGRVVAAVRSGLSLPAVVKRVDRRWERVWRYTCRIFFTRGPSCKPFFCVEEWEYVPAGQLNDSVVYKHSGGFALFVKLAKGELAGHLKYSAASFRSYGITVAVAPLESLEHDQVPVFCFRVTSVGLRIDKRCPRSVMFLSERPTNADEPTAWSVLDQKQVPSHALWLICDHGELDLGDGWEGDGSGRQAANPPAGSTDDALTDTIKRHIRRETAAKIAVWALATVGVPVIAILAVPDFWVQRETVVDFGVNWARWVLVLALVVLGKALWDQARWWKWRLTGGRGDKWTGRTTWALAAARMVRQVTLLPNKNGQDLWNSVWPQDCRKQTTEREHRSPDADQLE